MNIYQTRIENLRKQLKDLDTTIILFSGDLKHLSADADYPFEVNRNFFYFTGLAEDGLILVIRPDSTTIFLKRHDPLRVKWVGETIQPHQSQAINQINQYRYVDEFEKTIENGELFHLDFEDYNAKRTTTNSKLIRRLMRKHKMVMDINRLIVSLRLVKSKEEIEEIKRAINLTKLALYKTAINLKNMEYEYQTNAMFEGEIKNLGGQGVGFPTIASSGKNATTLHYVKNDAKLKKGELILLDLGARINYYSADISRTYPINGKFSKRQKEIYQLVLAGQELIIKTAKPGMNLRQLNDVLVAFYQKELPKIGLHGDVSQYYYHSVSHHLGLDIHDVFVPRFPLQAGNVITVEPGLYIEEEGIGIRIEDDILITEEENINLSNDIPKTIEEIEEMLMKGN